MKCVKSLNRIFWMIECWCKALKWPIWSTNKKKIIGLSISLFWNVSKASNRIFWVTTYWYKVPKCQIWSRNTKPFCRKVRQTLKFSKSFSHFEVTDKLVLEVVNSVKSVNYVLKYINLSTNTKPFFCEIDTNLETFL